MKAQKYPIPLRILILFMLLVCIACKKSDENPEQEKTQPVTEMAFDKIKWNTKDGSEYVYRDKMLKDLIANDRLKQLRKTEILDLLGQPNRIDNQFMFYTVVQERIGFFPLHTTTLVIKLSKDDTVEKVMVHK